MTKLYHATDIYNMDSIAKQGLLSKSYWTSSEELSDYYKETIIDEEKKPVILMIELDDLDTAFIKPDYPSIEEPITTVLGMDEDEVMESWELSTETWRDSLEIVGSICYHEKIDPAKILVMTEYDVMPLLDYVKTNYLAVESEIEFGC